MTHDEFAAKMVEAINRAQHDYADRYAVLNARMDLSKKEMQLRLRKFDMVTNSHCVLADVSKMPAEALKMIADNHKEEAALILEYAQLAADLGDKLNAIAKEKAEFDAENASGK